MGGTGDVLRGGGVGAEKDAALTSDVVLLFGDSSDIFWVAFSNDKDEAEDSKLSLLLFSFFFFWNSDEEEIDDEETGGMGDLLLVGALGNVTDAAADARAKDAAARALMSFALWL